MDLRLHNMYNLIDQQTRKKRKEKKKRIQFHATLNLYFPWTDFLYGLIESNFSQFFTCFEKFQCILRINSMQGK